MEISLDALQRKLAADPGNPNVLNELARAKAKLGRLAEAYRLLLNHGADERRNPFFLELRAQLAASDVKTLSHKYKQYSAIAVDKNLHTRSWRWLSLNSFKKRGQPVLAIKTLPGSEPHFHFLASLPLLGSIDLSKAKIPHDEFDRLSALASLHSLTMFDAEICDEALSTLSSLRHLRSIDLQWCEGITDAGLTHLSPLTNLRRLDLAGCRGITAKGLTSLAALSQLQSLDLNATGIDEAKAKKILPHVPRIQAY